MRPVHTHGSAHRVDLVARPSRHQDNWLAGSEWRCLPQGAVRTVAVVMVGVVGQHRPQLPAPKISIRSSTSRRTVPTHRSA
jgi:hypothetical protein